MEKFVGIKFVLAEPMLKSVAVEKGYRVGDGIEEDGYEVLYDNNYKSWCPKSVFEKSNFTPDDEILAHTLKLMCSDDWKQRLLGEYIQVRRRLSKLEKFVESGLEVSTPKSLFEIQIRAMKDYLAVIESRAKIEGVELEYPNPFFENHYSSFE